MIVPVDIVAVQCNQNNSLFVTTGVDYDSDGAVVGSEIVSQYTLIPGDSLDGKPAEAVRIATALWTPEVIAAWAAAHPKIEPEIEIIEVTDSDTSISTDDTLAAEIAEE
jgi:hypothetical protein